MKYSLVKFSSNNIQEWQKDLLIDSLADFGFDTFEDTDTGFNGYIPAAQLLIPALDGLLMQNSEDYAIDYQVVDLPEENWNKLWESNFQPIVVDDRCYVRATFHSSKPDFPYELVVEPRMAFGTGHHQTTSMMLSYILDSDPKDKRVLDMGCGTGILAILAAKMGAKDILAIDIDDVCTQNVVDNQNLNGLNTIRTLTGTIDRVGEESFDVIYANINRNILLDHIEIYSGSLTEGGELYLSGFYDGDDLALIQKSAQSNNLDYKSKKVTDNWCAAKFVKK